MKKVFYVMLIAFAVSFVSCTPEALEDEKTELNGDDGGFVACPAPDTNCNGIPDHEE